MSIPDIFAGERRDVLLELSIPADLAGRGLGFRFEGFGASGFRVWGLGFRDLGV